MRILIVEDDLTSITLMKSFLASYGECVAVSDGRKALNAFREAAEQGIIFNLICLDIMMPNMDGLEALQEIRKIETDNGISGLNKVKVIMTTALEGQQNVMEAFFKGGASSYLVKPIEKVKLEVEMKKLGLIN